MVTGRIAGLLGVLLFGYLVGSCLGCCLGLFVLTFSCGLLMVCYLWFAGLCTCVQLVLLDLPCLLFCADVGCFDAVLP